MRSMWHLPRKRCHHKTRSWNWGSDMRKGELRSGVGFERSLSSRNVSSHPQASAGAWRTDYVRDAQKQDHLKALPGWASFE